MNIELKDEILCIWQKKIDGGCARFSLELWMEDAPILADNPQVTEWDLCRLFDDNFFYCTVCGWTLPIDDNGEDTEGGEMQCMQCENESA